MRHKSWRRAAAFKLRRFIFISLILFFQTESIERISSYFWLFLLFLLNWKVVTILRGLNILRIPFSIFTLDEWILLFVSVFAKSFDLFNQLLNSFKIKTLIIVFGHSIVGDFFLQRVGVILQCLSVCICWGLYYLIKNINL